MLDSVITVRFGRLLSKIYSLYYEHSIINNLMKLKLFLLLIAFPEKKKKSVIVNTGKCI